MKYITSFILALLFSTQVAAEVNEAYLYRSGIWSTKLIPVCWETGGFDRDKSLARQAIEETWQAESALTFFGWGQCLQNSVGIRIQISDTGPHVKALGSKINGMRNGMVLNFTYNNWSQSCRNMRDFCNKVIAVHEFGHALAFAHEQNRRDTPAWCADRHPAQGTDGDAIVGDWDIDSVMNYCNPKYSNNGNLSFIDTRALRNAYGKPEWKPAPNENLLLAAARVGNLEDVKKYLTPKTIDAQDSYEGHTALALAADKCHMDVAKYILNSGILSRQDVNRRNVYRDTALAISLGTDKGLRDKGIVQPRCAELAPYLRSFGGQL